MRKKDLIKKLERENEVLKCLNIDQAKKIEILQFIVDKGRNPVEFVGTGNVQIYIGSKDYDRCEDYKVKYITVIGDINYLNLGYLSYPKFDVKSNDERECIFTIREKQGALVRWFKLFKDRKLVVDIPEPKTLSKEGADNDEEL